MRRLTPITKPVRLSVDGDEVVAEEGEPIAISIATSGRLVLGRSVKYHRPRGAVCYSGRCDGCLMRVDGRPSVMTCRAPARHGARVETQNVVGSAERDLLGVTDWFFPGGMNHHEMFTWSRSVNRAMQKVARRVAGVGTLPDEPVPALEPERVRADVLVVGAGAAGATAALSLRARGLSVVLVDEEPAAGGSLRWREPGAGDRLALAQRLHDQAGASGLQLMLSSSVSAIYAPSEGPAGAHAPSDRPFAIVDAQDSFRLIEPRAIVIAAGRTEGSRAFVGSDLPGVIQVDAAWRLLARGVLPGERVVLVAAGPGAASLALALRAAGASVEGPHPIAWLRSAHGRNEVRACVIEGERLACDCLVVEGETSAAYELAAQAGARMRFSGTGFELDLSRSDGAPAPCVIGAAAGVEDLEAAIEQARLAADALAAEL